MHRTPTAIAIIILIVATAGSAAAQTIVPLPDYDAARAGLRVGYGGRGLDLQASVDSSRFVSLVRVGVGAFVPHGDDFAALMGKRLILGMEHSGYRWTVGPEIEIDLSPRGRDRFGRRNLVPTMRMGIALRRNF
jgi:hypothetical protein